MPALFLLFFSSFSLMSERLHFGAPARDAAVTVPSNQCVKYYPPRDRTPYFRGGYGDGISTRVEGIRAVKRRRKGRGEQWRLAEVQQERRQRERRGGVCTHAMHVSVVL